MSSLNPNLPSLARAQRENNHCCPEGCKIPGVREGKAHRKALCTGKLSFQKVSISKAELHGRTRKEDNSALPRRAQSPPPRSTPVSAGTGRAITGSSAASLGPAALHASGPLSLRFGPGEWAGSDLLAGETEPGPAGGVTHRRERSLWPQVPDSLTGGRRCECWPPAPGSRKRSVRPSSPEGWGGGGGGGSCPRFRIRHQKAPVGKLTIGQLGRGRLGYRALVSIATGGLSRWPSAFRKNLGGFLYSRRPSVHGHLPRPPTAGNGGEPATPPPAPFRRVMEPAVGVNTHLFTHRHSEASPSLAYSRVQNLQTLPFFRTPEAWENQEV